MNYTIGWLLWFAWFGAEEYYSVQRGTWRDTLSGHIWIWFGIRDKDGYWLPVGHGYRWRRVFLLAFLAWLTVHFMGGGTIV